MKSFQFFTWHHMTSWSSVIWHCGWEPLSLSHHCANSDAFRSHVRCFHLEIWLSKREPLSVSHHSAKFDVYMSCAKGDETSLIRHVTLCSLVIKCHITHNPHNCVRLEGYESTGSRDVTFSFCHLTSPEYIIKGVYGLVTGSPPT